VPQSPDGFSASQTPSSYLAAWQAIGELLHQGRPWSGHERHCAFLNTGGQRFANVSAVTGLDFTDDGRGLALADWDLDGDLDVWLANRTGPRLRWMRNETEPGDRFVAFRLEGTTSNRDAIGSRVEVRLRAPNDANAKLVQTLQAGDAFLSQSSKWLHFGLGPRATVRDVMIRWPDNKQETFTGAERGGRYVLKQGTGVAGPWQLPARSIELKPSDPPPFQSREAARVVLSQPIPLPVLEYDNATNDQRTPVAPRNGKPLLVTLWASWCTPCIEELRALTEQQQRLDAAGIEILALSVDSAAEGAEGGRQAAMKLMKRIEFPQGFGFATPTMLDKLQRLLDALFATHVQLAVPTSFLLDREGHLAVIYRGPVHVDELLEDVRHTSATVKDRRDRAVPLAGRWYTQPGRFQLDQLAAAYTEAYPDDAERYLKLALRASEADRGIDRVRDERVRIHLRLAHLAQRQGRFLDVVTTANRALAEQPDNVDAMLFAAEALRRLGRNDEAIDMYLKLLRLDPDRAQTRYNLAGLLARVGRTREAIEQFRLAIRINPQFATALHDLGRLLARENRLEEAADRFGQAVDVDPARLTARLDLAALCQRLGRVDEARSQYEQVLDKRPEHAAAQLAFAELLRKQGSFAKACTHYRQSLQVKGDQPIAHFGMAMAEYGLGETAKTVEHLRAALRLNPDYMAAANNLAWLLATHPDDPIRDGKEAVALADRVLEAAGRETPQLLDTLAAAQAEAGDFEAAVATAEKAARLARAGGQGELAADIQSRLKKYRDGHPHRAEP